MFEVVLGHSRAGNVVDATTEIAEAVANGYVVNLFKSGFAPNNLMVHADFLANVCDFTGYAAKTIGGAGFLFVGPMVNAAGDIVYATPSMTWIATDAVTPNSVGGGWVENTANAVRRYFVFPAPKQMDQALDFIDFTIFEQPGSTGYVDGTD
jgi:hypothetical protein